jgi:hypothetical protein
MDDVFEHMLAFRHALARFQEVLEASAAEIRSRHDEVDPLWQDEARRFYDAHYGPLHAMLQRYLHFQGPDYLRFLEEKLRAIDAYLHG